MTEIGDRLTAERRRRGWTLREAERRSGVPNAHISQVETGMIRRPGTGVLIRLAAVYEIPLPELLALAGRADFGTVGGDGRLADHEGHDLWHMAVYLPAGREAEVAEWMAAHGIEVYRMYRPAELLKAGREGRAAL